MDLAEKARLRRRIWLILAVIFLVSPAALFAGSLWGLSGRAPWLRTGAAVAFVASAGLAIGAFGWVRYRDSLTWVMANDVSIYAYDPSAGAIGWPDWAIPPR